jgi:methyl-accepting chemotaxis protein
VVKDVITSYEVLVNLFERIQGSLQRLNLYVAVPLTPEMILLLGKIMAQVLSVLGLSTKAMKERRISECSRSMTPFMAHSGTETFMKRLVGKKDLEDGLDRLDMLTKEENLMTAARNLQVTHQVDVNVKVTQEITQRVDDKVTTVEKVVHIVDDNVKATKELAHATKEATRNVHDDVKVTRHGAQRLFELFVTGNRHSSVIY